MKNSKQPIIPFYLEKGIVHPDQLFGLTKREYFAGLAMQGLISKGVDMMYNPNDIANYAVDYADSLLKQLEIK